MNIKASTCNIHPFFIPLYCFSGSQAEVTVRTTQLIFLLFLTGCSQVYVGSPRKEERCDHLLCHRFQDGRVYSNIFDPSVFCFNCKQNTLAFLIMSVLCDMIKICSYIMVQKVNAAWMFWIVSFSFLWHSCHQTLKVGKFWPWWFHPPLTCFISVRAMICFVGLQEQKHVVLLQRHV